MAFIASWPEHAPKCPVREVKKRFKDATLKEDFHFEDLRTAFVLHFFQPGDVGENEFEFQPEGFRHYLLAEWCVRAQFEALRDQRRPTHSCARSRNDAMTGLAQFPLREVERDLLNEIYEDLGSLAREPSEALVKRLQYFGVTMSDPKKAAELVESLYERVRDDVESPPATNFVDHQVGVPEGQQVPPGLNSLRLLVNYWDQCLIATSGLYRGLGKIPQEETIFKEDPGILARYLRVRDAVRGFHGYSGFMLSRFGLKNAKFFGSFLIFNELVGTDLSRADLFMSNLTGANLSGANLSGANLSGSKG